MFVEDKAIGQMVKNKAQRVTTATPCAAIEWQTVALIAGCFALWAVSTTWIAGYSTLAAILVTALMVALQSSLQHEALHGHPTRVRWLNEALVFPALGVLIPYGRFRDTHLDHHRDPLLTDPYDDPETNYLDPAVWNRLPRWQQFVLRINNTLAGRVLLGTAVAQTVFVTGDLRAIRAGNRQVLKAWLWHIPAVGLVLLWLTSVGQIPLWAYALAAYLGLSLIKIRTFLEHRAHEEAKARTVIIEDRGPLAFLFLNNNLHAVHHDRPGVPWYRLPQLYAANRGSYLASNDGYVYRSYLQVARLFLLRRKDPVAHPFWR